MKLYMKCTKDKYELPLIVEDSIYQDRIGSIGESVQTKAYHMTDMGENTKLQHGWMQKDVRHASFGRSFLLRNSRRQDGESWASAIAITSLK